MMDSSEISLEHALNATNALYLRSPSKPNVVELPPGVVKLSDLPLEIMKNDAKVRHVFDVIGEVDFPEVKRNEVTNACVEGRFHDLPEPICLKNSPGMQFEYQCIKVYKVKGATKPYACNKVKGKKAKKIMKPATMKAMKAMKVMKSMKVMKAMKSMK